MITQEVEPAGKQWLRRQQAQDLRAEAFPSGGACVLLRVLRVLRPRFALLRFASLWRRRPRDFWWTIACSMRARRA